MGFWWRHCRFINSMAPGRSQCNFKNVIFNLPLLMGIFKSAYDKILRWMPQDLTVDKSTLVQVMAWCRQATSHYLNQCWPRSPTPYGPQWVNDLQLSAMAWDAFHKQNFIRSQVFTCPAMVCSKLWPLWIIRVDIKVKLTFNYELIKHW